MQVSDYEHWHLWEASVNVFFFLCANVKMWMYLHVVVAPAEMRGTRHNSCGFSLLRGHILVLMNVPLEWTSGWGWSWGEWGLQSFVPIFISWAEYQEFFSLERDSLFRGFPPLSSCGPPKQTPEQ